MAEAEVELLFENDRTAYRPGDRIRGVARVRVHQPCGCVKLVADVYLVLAYSMRKDIQRWKEGRTLAEGVRWEPGEEHRFPFDFEAPTVLPSYGGTLVSLRWELRIAMELGGEAPAVATRAFQMLPPANPGVWVQAKTPADRRALTQVKTTPVLVAGVVVLFSSAVAVFGQFAENLIITVGGAVVGFLGLICLPLAIRDFALRRRVGNVQIDFADPHAAGYREAEVAPRATCTVWTLPSAPVERVELRMVAEEQVVTGGSSDKKSYLQKVHDESAVLSPVSPGSYEGLVPVSPGDDTPYSRAHLHWTAVARILTKGGGVVEQSATVTVLPDEASRRTDPHGALDRLL